ncbi:MAG: IS256 family transposase [Xanthomonadales bacterium]|nr:IS256 family transposase [Xanthomonadales bacterium]NIX13881.1 IS256 family transposase [Xanthomonadales bacterium]
MIHEKLKEAFLQGEEREAADLMRKLLQRSVRLGLYEAMASEVEALCGPKYRPDPESELRRAGSERGVAYLDGGKEEIVRPRVREKDGGEVRLATYEAASSPKGLFDQVVAAVAQGLPIRGVERATSRAVSRSEASRMWVEKSREQLELLRNRPLADNDWLAILIDGVRLADELWVIVAVGINVEGEKRVLDFQEGSSENATSVGELLGRLARRGVREPEKRRLLVLRDGSAAIHKAVQQHWPSSVQQECLVHAQSNLRDKLKCRDRADMDRHFRRLRQAQGKEAVEEAFEELLEFVSERNAEAALNLKSRTDRLLAFQRLEVPATLNRTFLSTNLIENVLRNWREATGNVKRWSEKKDMVSRWMASGLLWAEAGFRKVRHAEDLPQLKVALEQAQQPKAK